MVTRAPAAPNGSVLPDGRLCGGHCRYGRATVAPFRCLLQGRAPLEGSVAALLTRLGTQLETPQTPWLCTHAKALYISRHKGAATGPQGCCGAGAGASADGCAPTGDSPVCHLALAFTHGVAPAALLEHLTRTENRSSLCPTTQNPCRSTGGSRDSVSARKGGRSSLRWPLFAVLVYL